MAALNTIILAAVISVLFVLTYLGLLVALTAFGMWLSKLLEPGK